MHEPIKRALFFSILSVTALLFTSLILKPTLTPKNTINVFSTAVTIKAFLYSFKPFNILLASTNSYSAAEIPNLLKLSTPSLTPLITPSIGVEGRELNLTVIYKNELVLSEALTYDVIVLPSSGISLPRGLEFSDKRAIVIYDDGHKLGVELIPYYNYTLKDSILIIDIFLFKCKLELKERMNARFIGYMETTTYLRSYESVGNVRVLFNSFNVIYEYAKVIVIRVHYEVWAIG